MLDIITLYYFTHTAASSARFYWEAQHEDRGEERLIALPSAFAIFPKDIAGASRRWAEKKFSHIAYWGEPESGGHFAAFEKPDMFIREVRDGLRRLKQVSTE